MSHAVMRFNHPPCHRPETALVEDSLTVARPIASASPFPLSLQPQLIMSILKSLCMHLLHGVVGGNGSMIELGICSSITASLVSDCGVLLDASMDWDVGFGVLFFVLLFVLYCLRGFYTLFLSSFASCL